MLNHSCGSFEVLSDVRALRPDPKEEPRHPVVTQRIMTTGESWNVNQLADRVLGTVP